MTASLARGVLAELASGEPGPTPTAAEAAEALRVCLLRLRTQRIEEAMRDGRVLLDDAVRDGDRERLASIEQHIMRLGREKAEVTRQMAEPAGVGGRRS